jgi:glycosyltransferase involved in cell wall biosynthesis
MKVLLLCNKSPWPLREGGPIAMYAIINGLLKAGHTVKVLAANTNKYFVDPTTLPADFVKKTRIEFATIDLSVKPLGALYNFIRGRSYHVARFRNKDFEQKLLNILQKEEFDVIQTEMIYTTVYLDIIKRYSKAKIILRAHNIEHLIWKRIAGNHKNVFKKFYLEHLFRTLRDYELQVIRQVDGIAAITETDAAFFRQYSGEVPVIAVPFGIDPNEFPDPVLLPSSADIFHIGAMNWLPNEEGIRWFLNNVWPEIIKEFPSLTLNLAGRMMPDWLTNIHSKGVIVAGEVPDALEFMAKHSIMIVPLFSGSGIRIKIIEAMMAGKVVIASSIGAEGIHCTHGKDILIADSKDAFVEAIRLAVGNPLLRKSIGENARNLMLSQHNNNQLIEHLTQFYQRLTGS